MSVDEFVSELSALADADGRRELRPIIDGLSRPIRVRTVGRPGVGLRTLTAGLRAAGLAVVDTGADVEVLVIAETAKPEDCRITAAADGPIVVALNKADLLGAAVARIRDAGVTTAVRVSPQNARALTPALVAAGVDLLVIQGTIISAERVAQDHGVGEPLNLAAGSLLRYLPLLLVPPAVVVMVYASDIAADFWAIVGALVLSLILSMAFAGVLMQRLVKRHAPNSEDA